jgi:hypothetical protein
MLVGEQDSDPAALLFLKDTLDLKKVDYQVQRYPKGTLIQGH